MKIVLNGIITNNLTTAVVFITPLQNNDAQYNDITPNSLGLYLKDYVKAIKDVCQIYSISVLDLYSTSGINILNYDMVARWFTPKYNRC